jgi:hypothetical protein
MRVMGIFRQLLYERRGCSRLYFSSAAVATFSSCSSLAISSSLGLGRARAVTSISSRVATRVSS